MNDGLQTTSWIVFGLFGAFLIVMLWAASRARARGRTLGAAFVPNALIGVAALLGLLNLATGFSPKWFAYLVLALQGGLLVCCLPWLWRLTRDGFRG